MFDPPEAFSFRGPLDPTGGSAQTPVIGSHAALAMVRAPPLFIQVYAYGADGAVAPPPGAQQASERKTASPKYAMAKDHNHVAYLLYVFPHFKVQFRSICLLWSYRDGVWDGLRRPSPWGALSSIERAPPSLLLL